MREPLIEALRCDNGRFLQVLIVGILVYLATITLATMLLVNEIGNRWHEGVSGRMTVQLPAFNNDALRSQRVNAALATIQALPEVAHVELIAEGRLVAQVLPWLGSMPLSAAPLLSSMLEVELKPVARDAAPAVREHLRAELDDAEIMLGSAFLEPVRRLIRTVKGLTLLVQWVLAAMLCASVVLATFARLEASDETVQLIHLLGADDAVIIGVIICAALRTALMGALIGSAMAVTTLLALARIAVVPGVETVTVLSLSPAGWSAISLLPLAAALIAVFAAWFAARRTLAAMP